MIASASTIPYLGLMLRIGGLAMALAGPNDNVAVIRTQRRLLTYRAPTGSWSERRIDLHD